MQTRFRNVDAWSVVVTRGCNLACKYCYIHAYANPPPRIMQAISLDVVYRVVDMAVRLKTKGKPAAVWFLGGESLLHWKDVIVPAVEYAIDSGYTVGRDNGADIYFGITTNGVLISDEVAVFT